MTPGPRVQMAEPPIVTFAVTMWGLPASVNVVSPMVPDRKVAARAGPARRQTRRAVEKKAVFDFIPDVPLLVPWHRRHRKGSAGLGLVGGFLLAGGFVEQKISRGSAPGHEDAKRNIGPGAVPFFLLVHGLDPRRGLGPFLPGLLLARLVGHFLEGFEILGDVKP